MMARITTMKIFSYKVLLQNCQFSSGTVFFEFHVVKYSVSFTDSRSKPLQSLGATSQATSVILLCDLGELKSDPMNFVVQIKFKL